MRIAPPRSTSTHAHGRASGALALVTALAATLPPATADAGPRARDSRAAPSDRAKRATAASYVDAAIAAMDSKDWATAIDLFERAYDLVPEPELLFYIAESHRGASHHADALRFYRRYLDAKPDGTSVAAAKAQLAPLTAAVKSDEDRKAAAARAEQEARDAEAARLAAAEQAKRDAEAALAAEQERARQAELAEQRRLAEAKAELERARRRAAIRHRADRFKLGGLAIAAGGLAGLGVGGYFGYRAHVLSDHVSAHYDAALADEGQRAERAQVISLSIGGALLAAGGALVFTGWRVGKRRPLVVTPAVETDGGGLTIVGGW